MTDHDRVFLVPHPVAPAPAGLSVSVRAQRSARGDFVLCYLLEGAIDALRIPAARTPVPGDNLWQHTCCEAFVASAGARAYREFNFSPSGCWAAYMFDDTRVRSERALPPWRASVSIERATDRFKLKVTVAAHQLPDAPWQIGLSAVLEARDGSLSFWALEHPEAKPDFHHRGGFALRLPEESTS